MSEITTSSAGQRKVTVDGIEFTADFDDAGLLTALMDVNAHAHEIASDDSLPTDRKLAAMVQLAKDAKAAIDAVLGDGAHERLFGEHRQPVLRALQLVAALAQVAGEAQAELYVEQTATE